MRNVFELLRHLAIFGSLFSQGSITAAERAPAPSLIYHSPLTGFQGASAVVAVQDVKVEVAVDGTYWCVLQWDTGYMGLQQGGSGFTRHIHFSVWDPADGGETFIAATPHPNTQGGRFGGEGTGVVTYHPYNWQPDVTYSFAIAVSAYDGGSQYKGYFLDPAEGHWRLLATIRRPKGPTTLGYVSSFLEDFASTSTMRRSGLFGNAWVQAADGTWSNPTSVYFNASIPDLAHQNFDGDPVGLMFRLETGGNTVKDTDIQTYSTLEAGVRSFPELEPYPARIDWDLHNSSNSGAALRAIWRNSSDKFWLLQSATTVSGSTGWQTLNSPSEADGYSTMTFPYQTNKAPALFLRLIEAHRPSSP